MPYLAVKCNEYVLARLLLRDLYEGGLNTMGLLLNVDDIEAGMMLAVYGPVHKPTRARKFHPEHEGMREMLVEEHSVCNVPPGVPMEVIGVSPPFLACCIVEPGGGRGGPVILDLRRTRLCRLLGGFAEAIEQWQPQVEAVATTDVDEVLGLLKQGEFDADSVDEERGP
jgi:hypothetical protein